MSVESNPNACPHDGLNRWIGLFAAATRRAVVDEGIRKVDAWTGRHRLATAEFPTEPVDPFFNANRPEDFDRAAALLGRLEI